jgi:hypothetical protein
MLLASAILPSNPTVRRERKRKAVFTKVAAGRAWRATPGGSATVDSELAGTASLFCRPGHILERLACRRHDRGRHRAFDEGSVDKADVTVGFAFEEVADGEDGAAEVGEDHDALAAVGPRDRLPHSIAGSAQRSSGGAARRLDLDLATGHLRGQIREAACELEAVGDQYNPDQIRHSQERLFAPRNRVPDDGRSLHYRQEFSNAE